MFMYVTAVELVVIIAKAEYTEACKGRLTRPFITVFMLCNYLIAFAVAVVEMIRQLRHRSCYYKC